MSLLGIDVGTTGCKAGIFSESGEMLALAYREYDPRNPRPDWAELDAAEVWTKVKQTISAVTQTPGITPIQALAVSTMGEAMVPVSKEREILGPSILIYDSRGQAYTQDLRRVLPDETLYPKTGNTFGFFFSMVKLMWVKENEPDLYARTDFFLPWTSFISFMLGADPVVDYALANRTLLFDINARTWSDALLEVSGIDREKLPETRQAGTVIGQVSADIAKELHLTPGLPIVMGTHDQCANAVGCGAIDAGQAMLGMGTFTTLVPVFTEKYDPQLAIPLGVNTEHHAVPDRFVSFIYNQGGSVVKWFRDTFAANDKKVYENRGEDIYVQLFSEIPESISSLILLPYFTTTGLPDFSPHTSGVITGLHLTSSRGEILQGIIESILFDLKMTIEPLREMGLDLTEYIAVGGGSKSDRWVQTCADIFGSPIRRPFVTEAGVLGSAMIAGVGSGIFRDYGSAVRDMVRMGDQFTPNLKKGVFYHWKYEKFLDLRNRLTPLLEDLSQEIIYH